MKMHGDGSYRREWIQVEDNCEGILAVMERGADNQIYVWDAVSVQWLLDDNSLIKELKNDKKVLIIDADCRRIAATAKANRQPPTPQAKRIVNGGNCVSRNLVCGQLNPQLQAVNSTRHRPSARVPRNRRLSEVDTNLLRFASGLDPQAELNSPGWHAIRLDRRHDVGRPQPRALGLLRLPDHGDHVV